MFKPRCFAQLKLKGLCASLLRAWSKSEKAHACLCPPVLLGNQAIQKGPYSRLQIEMRVFIETKDLTEKKYQFLLGGMGQSSRFTHSFGLEAHIKTKQKKQILASLKGHNTVSCKTFPLNLYKNCKNTVKYQLALMCRISFL